MGTKRNINRGRLLDHAVRNSGLSISKVAERAHYSRGSFYIHRKDPKLPFHILAVYGKVIKYDFSYDIPEMIERGFMYLEQPEELYGEPETFEEAIEQRNRWKDRCIQVQEKYQKLLEEMHRSR